MKNLFSSFGIFILALAFMACSSPKNVQVSSPNGKYKYELLLEDSLLYYQAFYEGTEIVEKSLLGFELSNATLIDQNLEITGIEETEVN
ncbi:glycoside hydrolase family 97 N-terminal domain-containing protein, partial [uncultured Cyclobacterium sp.]|uniref:glycoside hydrolase family 97 N-terminal domain-containing protein n=1 Tax=uncultured Cyclobacterium sp. TaxID=453820 RepID=UPI0030EB3CB7